MPVKEAMASEPSKGSAKVLPVQSQEVSTFNRVHLWEEYFGLPAVGGVMPLLVPGF